MLGGGLVIVLLGALFGVCLSPLSVVLMLYGLRTQGRRGRRATTFALGFCILALLLTGPVWRLAITGKGTDGSPVNVWDDSLASGLLLMEAVAFAAVVAGFVWKVRHRGDAAQDLRR